ncbi:MAG: TIGR03618 family F420-dependent PPOX class oxidoreductase [Chloroflexi bacterium]|nr:TIGR03618 family F420-dependent PPOX class oxidoreductase [Chloroflexota bacterium]
MPLSEPDFEQLMAGRHIAVLATIDRHGRPHQAPVWYTWRGGQAVVLTERHSQKWRNIERNPAASLCIDTKQPPLLMALLFGDAEELHVDYAAERAQLYERYVGAEQARARLGDSPIDPTASVVFAIRPSRIVTSGAAADEG